MPSFCTESRFNVGVSLASVLIEETLRDCLQSGDVDHGHALARVLAMSDAWRDNIHLGRSSGASPHPPAKITLNFLPQPRLELLPDCVDVQVCRRKVLFGYFGEIAVKALHRVAVQREDEPV